MRTLATALIGALVALAFVGGFMALDKSYLHVYTDATTKRPVILSTAQPTGSNPQAATAWYYLDEGDASGLTSAYGTQLPPCEKVIGRGGAVPASPGAPPIVTSRTRSVPDSPGSFTDRGVHERLETDVRVAIECQK